jgi:hypothetical protein
VIGETVEGKQEREERDGRRKGRNGEARKRAEKGRMRRRKREEEKRKVEERGCVLACVPSNSVCRADAVMNDLGGADSPREESLLSASMKRKSN